MMVFFLIFSFALAIVTAHTPEEWADILDDTEE